MTTITNIAIICAAIVGAFLAIFAVVGIVAFVIAAIEELTNPIKSACKKYKPGRW